MYSKTLKIAAFSAFLAPSMAFQGGVAMAGVGHSGGHAAKKHAATSHDAGIHSGGHAGKAHHGHEKDDGHAIGIGETGETGQIDRAITVVMGDNYFLPEKLKIEEDETIRFIVRNDGVFLHEFNIGTAALHAQHQEEMAMMAHVDPNSVLLEPGEQKEIVWHFVRVTDLEYGCNVPGHYDSGMVGPFQIQARPGISR
jgi:uncharacterized cupredoxin-like copper-binding protein